MVARLRLAALLALPLCLLGACGGDDKPGGISDGTTSPAGPTGGGQAGQGGAAGSGVGAPGDPPPSGEGFIQVGDKLDPELAWPGYVEGNPDAGMISLGDYFDPDGSKGITALLITEGQADCGPCIKEAKDIAASLPEKWTPAGIRVVQLVVSDIKGNPATLDTALAWKQSSAASWPVGADPNFTFAQLGSNPYPIQVIVDPRTLTVVDRLEGYRPTLPELEALAKKNR